jgi:hydrogenase nickel incorporation protein HypB
MPDRISIIENIMSANERLAKENRAVLDKAGVYSINIMALPGAGKTTFILKTLETLQGHLRMGVIEGDIATSLDSEKVAAGSLPTV